MGYARYFTVVPMPSGYVTWQMLGVTIYVIQEGCVDKMCYRQLGRYIALPFKIRLLQVLARFVLLLLHRMR